MDQILQYLNRYPLAGQAVSRGFHVLIVVAVVFACVKAIRLVCREILASARGAGMAGVHGHEREKRVSTVVKLVETTLTVILFGAAFLMVLREMGLDITPLLTGAGIAGVAVGFGAQSLVKDVISGFFILLEDQIRIGDVVRINGLTGSVERMQLRITAIRDGDGTLHIIPNGEIKSVSNMTYDFARAIVSIPVPYDVDSRKLQETLVDVAKAFDSDPEWAPELLGKTELVGITSFSPGMMQVQVKVKTGPHSRGGVETALRSRIKAGLDTAGIRMSAD